MKFARNKRWNEIVWVVGYVDSNGAVHAKIIFEGPDRYTSHSNLFPNSLRYKTWRWNKSEGLVNSSLAQEKADTTDYYAIHDWLFKNGCLNNWELDDSD